MSTQAPTSEITLAPRPGRRRPSWLLILPVVGALGAGAVAVSTAHAQAVDAGAAAAGPGFMARRLQHILDKVGATPGQRSQIQAIWSGLRPQIKTLRQQHMALHQQMVTALTGATINAAEVEKLRQQSIALTDKTSALFTQGIVATAQVLTPDQRKLAQQELAQRAQHRFGGGMGGGFGGPGFGP
jgi:Spy/CpxP family protein refolding chaperone